MDTGMVDHIRIYFRYLNGSNLVDRTPMPYFDRRKSINSSIRRRLSAIYEKSAWPHDSGITYMMRHLFNQYNF